MAERTGTVRARSSYVLGTIYLLVVVFLWTLSSFIMNTMFLDLNWPKPFLTTYLATSSFSLYLLKPAFLLLQARYKGSPKRDGYEPVAREETAPDADSKPPPRQLTIKETSNLALIFCFLWFAANWASNAALGLTTVSSVTILVSTSGFFTLAIGSAAGVESFSLPKLLAVTASVLGVILVSKSDTSITPLIETPVEADHDILSRGEGTPSAPHPLLGDLLALLSAFIYALYVTLLKVRIPHPSQIKMSLFFGFVGLYNILLLFPIIPLLHYLQIERFVLPKVQSSGPRSLSIPL
ncbi:hypothetical protein BT69DRAFT_1311958 [Atractiella rhizophila]|nr:hypothetical protein BT69DRAFT_1311958 [Atractiella rhizophila]